MRAWFLPLTLNDVLGGQGVRPDKGHRPALLQAAGQALAIGAPLLRPAVLMRRLAVRGLRHERLLLEDGTTLSGPLVGSALGRARHVALVLCTLGKQLEEVIASVMPDNPLLGLALDGLGTAAMEILAAQACNRVEKQAAAQGLQVSLPLSPGMEGWPLDPGQVEMFAALDGEQIGVTSNESLMMRPRKSLTFALGIGKDVTIEGDPCNYCSLHETCRYRRREGG